MAGVATFEATATAGFRSEQQSRLKKLSEEVEEFGNSSSGSTLDGHSGVLYCNIQAGQILQAV